MATVIEIQDGLSLDDVSLLKAKQVKWKGRKGEEEYLTNMDSKDLKNISKIVEKRITKAEIEIGRLKVYLRGNSNLLTNIRLIQSSKKELLKEDVLYSDDTMCILEDFKHSLHA
jgi:hypothetical protein